MPQQIEKLDPNFAQRKVEDRIQWINIRSLTLEGRAFNDTESYFDRWPARAKGLVPDAVWTLGQHSAGLLVRFQTNATKINAKWSLRNNPLHMDHMPATGMSGLDLYTRVQQIPQDSRLKTQDSVPHWLGVGRPTVFPTNQTPLTSGDLSPATRDLSLYLPLYNGTAEAFIGIPETATITPAAPRPQNTALCFYGTSITQGGCASRPGMAYPAIIARTLDRPHYNFGFSGSARCEPAVAKLLAELNPAAYILDPLPNMTADLVTERLAAFITILRDARPHTPIVLVENIDYCDSHAVPARRDRALTSNAALHKTLGTLRANGDQNLHLIPGQNLLGPDTEGTVDGVHPTDLGFLRIAQSMTPHIQKVLAKI